MNTRECRLCGNQVSPEELNMHREIEATVIASVRADHPEWQNEDGICEQCLQEVRRRVEAADRIRESDGA